LVERGKADRNDQQKALENSESDPCRGFILKIEGFLSTTVAASMNTQKIRRHEIAAGRGA
jgi:hypothetical protein